MISLTILPNNLKFNQVMEDENDGQILLKLLSSCKSESNILEIFGKVHGPYSFIYWQVMEWLSNSLLKFHKLMLLMICQLC